MNKLALVALGLFIIVEILLGDIVICGIPLWLAGLILFSVSWMAYVGIKDKVKIEDSI
ncbi:MAG: hypothetical protein ACLRT4_10905 [Thomasclavelia sp.]